jgi:putative transport protein
MQDHFLADLFHKAPEIALFLAIGLGYLVGRVKFGPFTLGATAGTLLVGVLIGILVPGLEFSPLIKSIFFAMFIYAVGFRTGPQFFRGFDRRMIKQVVLTVVVTVVGLICVLIGSKIMKLDEGMAAGLGAGSLTESAIIGTAGDAISRLGFDADHAKQLQNNIAIGYAVTYIFGTIGIIFFGRDIAPRLLGIKLKAASAEYETRMAGGKAPLKPGQYRVDLLRSARAFRVGSGGAGRTISQIESALGARCFVELVRRGTEMLKVMPTLALARGDTLVLAGQLKGMMRAPEAIGPETEDAELDVVGESVDVVVTHREAIGKKIGDYDADLAHGVFLRRIVRGDTEMPLRPDFEVQRGDTLTLFGDRTSVERVGHVLGSIERPTDKTDLLYCGTGIVVGTLLGLLSIRIGGVPVTLGAGGGVLVAGLVFGWLRSLQPTFGNFPAAVQTVFTDLGLNAFIGVVGLAAGPSAWNAIKETGVGLLIAGGFATMIPPFVGLYVGKLMKMEPVVLIGALCGARSANAAIGAVNEAAESSAPAVGFTVPYAIANVLLTVWGPVIVGIVHKWS